MRPQRRTALIAASAGALLSPGCGDAPSIAPPEIRLGQDVCDVCGMIISDDRFAAALVIDGGDGYESRAFDDIGCLLAYEERHPDDAVAARYVRAFRTRAWLDAAAAAYLHSGSLHTPMASGLAALPTEADARALAEEFPGDVIGYPTVCTRFASGDLTIFPQEDS